MARKNQKIVRAIDVGSNETKYTISDSREDNLIACEKFPSFQGLRVTMACSSPHLIDHAGRYKCGDCGNGPGTINRLQKQYVQTISEFALVCGALQRMKLSRIDVLTIGVPLSSYQISKAYLQRELNTKLVSFGSKTVSIGEVLVFPSGFGTIYDFKEVNKFTWEGRKNYLIIDVGCQYLCAYVFQGTHVYEKRIGSTTIGSTPFSLKGGEGQANIENVDESMEWVRAVISDDGDIDRVIVNGGGGLHLYKAIRRAWSQYEVSLSNQPFLSNVRGLQLKAEADLLTS